MRQVITVYIGISHVLNDIMIHGLLSTRQTPELTKDDYGKQDLKSSEHGHFSHTRRAAGKKNSNLGGVVSDESESKV